MSQTTLTPPVADNAADTQARILAAREILGDSALILGHFYERDEVVRHADFVGDSFQLARIATERPDAEHIVFCGVHFMAETADVLSTDAQSVYLPVPTAGCPMADMATAAQVEKCWDELGRLIDSIDEGAAGASDDARAEVIPVTYMNSAAAIKAFCGRNGGIVCTSSNADAVMEWCFERGKRVLFLPDANLGTNTAVKRGIPAEKIVRWDPAVANGGLTGEAAYDAEVIVWDGYCPIHQEYLASQVADARRNCPGARVLVHPECTPDVVGEVDGAGSTDFLVKAIAAAPAGSQFVIGTEHSLVARLAADHPEMEIRNLDPAGPVCPDMNATTAEDLAELLEALVAGRAPAAVRVPADIAADAKVALTRMLEVH